MSMTAEDRFFQKVRTLQRKTKCPNVVCNEFIRLYRQHAKEKENLGGLNSFDKKSKGAAGSNYFTLNGCPSCNKYIYRQEDKNKSCPFIKANGSVCGHPRYTEQNEPFEVRHLIQRKQFTNYIELVPLE